MPSRRHAGFLILSLLNGPLLRPQSDSAADDTLSIDLASSEAAKRWILDESASIRGGELLLDGRKRMSRAFFRPRQWGDVTLRASFLVESQSSGVLACGFVVRAADARTYYYVHFDRKQAILVRSDPDESWNEIKRVSGLEKPSGRWHTARLRCVGKTLQVFLNGKLLYEAEDATLARGRIGLYANQGLAHVKDIVVSGEAKPAPEAFPVPKPQYVIVCEDAGAGAYEAFPDVCRLKDGRLMCVFYAGYGHVALPREGLPRGGRISYAISSDEGRTWSAAKTLYDGPLDDRDPSIAQLPEGPLICSYFSLRRREGGAGHRFVGSFLITSDDGGRSWSEPRSISPSYACSAPVREISGGRLLLGLYSTRSGPARGAVTISDDRGKTWSDPIDIDNGGAHLDAETDIIQLRDGSLYAAQRGGKGSQMHWSISRDRGETWSVSKSIGFAAHCPYLHRTTEGILLLGHRLPATSLHYSLDEGKTWSQNVRVDTTGGAYPSMVDLRDGTVLIVYYEEGAGSDIRAKRFRATRAGIEWLRLD